MIENLSYKDFGDEMAALCQAAAEHQTSAVGRLAAILANADAPADRWPPELREAWETAAAEIAGTLEDGDLADDDVRLLKAFLKCGLDGHALRELYAMMARKTFPLYSNHVGLSEAIGFRDPATPVAVIASRWTIMENIRMGVPCFDPAFGNGVITRVDDLANEVLLQMGRPRVVDLRNFLDGAILVRIGSPLHGLLNRKVIGRYDSPEAFLAAMREGIVCAHPLPADIVRRILVPAAMTEGRTVEVEARREPERPAVKDISRWDTSRSIAELVDRLREAGRLDVPDPNLENVEAILRNACFRVDHVDLFAQATAMIEKDGTFSGQLVEILAPLAADAQAWNDRAVFLEVTDKVPGKLVYFWLLTTFKVMGPEFLVERTLELPYRLWTHVERILDASDGSQGLLQDRVFEAFAAGKVNAEMYFWLWKSAPDCELRSKYMSDSYLLFKTLHVEQRGSYLKSQRTLHKLLVDDERFQRTVMRQGDPEAIRSLVRCVKHQPLLDAGERQALLVKIVRYFPEAIHEVEERRKAPARRAVGKITSIRSYRQAELDLEDLINVQIPENVAAIEHARGLGDLRENSEFKFAKERQGLLGRQRSELERKLSETRATDFRDVRVNGVAVPGCSVEVTYVKDNRTETFWILGRFDSIPEENKISYETPLGNVLLGHKVKDEVMMPSGDRAILSKVEPLAPEMLDWLGSAPGK